MFSGAGGGARLATIPVVALVSRSLVIALTLAGLAGAAEAPATRAAAVVERVTLRDATLEIGVTHAVPPAVHRLQNPPRVYVDLADATIAPSVARALDGTGLVRKVRLGQFDRTTVRVVVELAGATPLAVEPDAKALRLVFGKDGTIPPAPVAKQRAVVAPTRAAAAADAMPPDVPRLTVIRTETPLAAVTTPASPPAVTKAVAGDLPTALQERIARRSAAEDWPGVVALYGANIERIRQDVDSTTRAAVVDALRELGLVHSARKLLGPGTASEPPALKVARAELALAENERDDAAALVTGLDEAAVDPALAPKLHRLRVRLALARGDLEGAAAGIGERANPELRAELAHAAIAAGRTAGGQRACRRGIVAFRQALDADGGRTARAAAGAGLVRSALACADREATMTGLGVLAESPHPLLRRAASVIATTQEDEQHAPGARSGRRGG